MKDYFKLFWLVPAVAFLFPLLMMIVMGATHGGGGGAATTRIRGAYRLLS